MVVNHRRLGLQGRSKLMGVALEPSAAAEFAQFKMVLPAMRRVVTFYAPDESATRVRDAQAESKKLGIELIAVPVSSARDVQDLYDENTREADAVWLLSDPVVMNPDTFEFMTKRGVQRRIPMLASFSETFAREGALVAVSADLTAFGSERRPLP